MKEAVIANGTRDHVIDAKGRKRGMKEWVVCPLCGKGRWVREDSLKLRRHTAFCKICHNKMKSTKLEDHGRWSGGKKLCNRYVTIRIHRDDPFYCMATNNGYALEHRIVMARFMGRALRPWELVHHIDGNKANNKIENLQFLEDKAHHWTSVQVVRMVRKLEERIEVLDMEKLELMKKIKQLEEERGAETTIGQ